MYFLYAVFLSIIGLILLSIAILYLFSLYFAFTGRRSKPFNSSFFKIWWNGGFMDLFAIVFYAFTMYPRCFYATSTFFLSLNKFKFFTKFALITQEHILYIQLTNIMLTMLCRTLTVCFALSGITKRFNSLSRGYFLILQLSMPTAIVIPLYFIADPNYGVKGLTAPLLLSSQDNKYNEGTFIIWVLYGFTVLTFSLFGYLTMLYTVKKNIVSKGHEAKILTHCSLLIIALTAVLGSLSARRFRFLEGNSFMKLFFFTSILWIPFTNLIVTLYSTKPLRYCLLSLFVKINQEDACRNGNLVTALK